MVDMHFAMEHLRICSMFYTFFTVPLVRRAYLLFLCAWVMNALMIWCTMGICRSILTQPWMEIGGKMNVTCEQTGCHAMVEFHCKVRKTRAAVMRTVCHLGEGQC